MIITTARKPSSKTRTFCRRLGRFTGWEYISRGKASLAVFGDESFLLVGECKGNPGSFNFFLNGSSVLSIYATVSMDRDIEYGAEPVIEGDSQLARALSKVTGLGLGGLSERVIRVSDKIEFIDKDVPVIILKILGTRGEGIA